MHRYNEIMPLPSSAAASFEHVELLLAGVPEPVRVARLVVLDLVLHGQQGVGALTAGDHHAHAGRIGRGVGHGALAGGSGQGRGRNRSPPSLAFSDVAVDLGVEVD